MSRARERAVVAQNRREDTAATIERYAHERVSRSKQHRDARDQYVRQLQRETAALLERVSLSFRDITDAQATQRANERHQMTADVAAFLRQLHDERMVRAERRAAGSSRQHTTPVASTPLLASTPAPLTPAPTTRTAPAARPEPTSTLSWAGAVAYAKLARIGIMREVDMLSFGEDAERGARLAGYIDGLARSINSISAGPAADEAAYRDELLSCLGALEADLGAAASGLAAAAVLGEAQAAINTLLQTIEATEPNVPTRAARQRRRRTA